MWDRFSAFIDGNKLLLVEIELKTSTEIVELFKINRIGFAFGNLLGECVQVSPVFLAEVLFPQQEFSIIFDFFHEESYYFLPRSALDIVHFRHCPNFYFQTPIPAQRYIPQRYIPRQSNFLKIFIRNRSQTLIQTLQSLPALIISNFIPPILVQFHKTPQLKPNNLVMFKRIYHLECS